LVAERSGKTRYRALIACLRECGERGLMTRKVQSLLGTKQIAPYFAFARKLVHKIKAKPLRVDRERLYVLKTRRQSDGPHETPGD
jgi:hypothetical protein